VKTLSITVFNHTVITDIIFNMQTRFCVLCIV